jgi:histidine triad (HIT) family protein
MSCVFCKIVAGEIPSQKVYEDDNFIAILDKFPKSPGHCQMIPKKHYRWVWDVPILGPYFEACGKLVKAQQKAFKTDYVQSRVMGDEVHHAHIWLVPIHDQKLTDEAKIAQMIREQVS